MVSPSKAKLSRIASQQSQQQQPEPEPEPQPQPSQQQPPQRKSVASTASSTSNNKVKLVKGSKPLIHHRFYLDIERHQVATKIESTIKELGGTVEFFLSKTITHFITDKQQPVDSTTGGSVAVVAAQTGEWNEEHQPQATATRGASAYHHHRIAVAVSPTSSAPATRSSLTNVANRRSQQPGRRTSARNTYNTHHPTPRQYNHGQYVNDIGSATSRTSSPCPPPASTTPTPPPATSSTSLAGHVRQQQRQQQKQQLGATAIASSSAGGGNSPSTAATPLATATLGFDGRVKPTQPAAAALPRSRADAMLQRVRQQQQQRQQQNQQHQPPHHQPSYHVLPSSPLKYNISSPSAVTTLGHSNATPIKRTGTPSPSTFNNPSSHHKQQPPASPCYSPVPAPGTAGGEGGWWGEHVTRSVALPVQNSPIHLASSWGTPVWSPEHALKFLRKVLDSVRNENHPEHKHRHHHHQHQQGHQQQHHHRSAAGGSTRASSSSSRHAHHLHGRFLKVESISNATAYRPFYQEFKQWPDLLLVRRHTRDLGEGKKAPFADVHELPKAATHKVTETAASPPVSTEVASGARMTRKLNARTSTTMVASARSASVQEQKPSTPNTAKKRAVTLLQQACETAANEGKKDKTAPAPPPKDCGYCEICRIEYDSLALHVDSESHRTFVQNDENFQSLDQLIGSIGEFGGNTDDGDDGAGRFGLLGGLLVDNGRKDCGGVGAAGGNEAPADAAAAAATGGGGGLSLHRENNETDERLLQLMEVEPQTGKRRNSLSTATVKTTVTTTTTAAVDEQQIDDKATELHRTIKETANASSRKLRLATKTSVATGEQQEQQRVDLLHNRNVKQARKNEATYDETKVNSSCIAKAPESDAKQLRSVKRPTVKGQTEGPGEPIDHDSTGDSVPHEESTSDVQENSSLIKRAIASVIASFDAGSDDEDEESDSLVASEHKIRSPLVNPVVPVKKTRKECAAASVQECGTSKGTPLVSEAAAGDGKRAKSECIVEQLIDFVVEEKDEQCSVKQGGGRRTKQIVTGVAVHTVRRSNRTSGAAIEEAVLSGTEEAQRSSASLTTEQQAQQESGGMFGRRSAIHHHPHNQLNHHKHQKHKSTLSALLLKQQQERQQELLEQVQQTQRNRSSDHDPDDHAAGMKVISDYHHEQQQTAELQKFSSEVSGVVVGLEQKQKPSVGRRKRGRGAGSVAIGHRRLQQQQQRQQLEALECQNKTLAAAMGLKASTTAMNKHHHHLPNVDGVSDVGGGGGGLGAKTRLAEAALLECEGLDPKNTKRISLGLRQNPKRANLNEDFTSLLDETLERSRLISSSSSSSAATITSAAPSAPTSTVAARKAQARIRQLQHKTKDKDKPSKRKERSDIDTTNDSAAAALDQLSNIGSAGMKRGSTKKVGSAALEDIKVRGIRWRAPSPASRPPVKSPLLYKVIEPSMPSATAGNDDETADATISRAAGGGQDGQDASKSERKAGANQRSRKSKSDQQQQQLHQQSSPTKNGLIVKIRRVRQSELSLLNDEAENFMFPKKDESSSDSDTDDGRQTSSEGCRATGAEPGGGPTRNNFSLDIPSSSELERSSKCVEGDDEEEDDHDSEVEHEANDGRTAAAGAAQRRDVAAAKGCRKRRKPSSSSNKLQAADASNRGDSVESEPSSCASSSSGSSFVIEPIVKRARFDSQLTTAMAADRLGSGSVKSGRRKASFGTVGVFDDGSDPPGSRTRFPTAPIQPTPVAVDERITSTTTAAGGKQSYDKDDDDDDDNGDDDEENDNNAKKRVPSFGRGRGKKGRLRQVKHMEKEIPESIDRRPECEEITDSVVPLREDSVSSPSQLSTCTCYSTGNGSSYGAVRNRGRGSGRGGSRRGRRGRGGAASVAARSWAARGRGSRMPLCGCRLQLLDATRMPPPASPVSPGRHDTPLESRSDSSSGTPLVLGSRRSGASKTKTTPPAVKSRRGASTRAGQNELDHHHQPHESSFSSTEAISGSYNIACNSSSSHNKGKEDGMGAVFKWINFRKRCEEIESYRFAFERVPSLEPWYETFQRQDDATEQVYEYFGSTAYRKLPYEMGPLPALSQNCCILNYKVVACRKSNRTASQQSFSPSSVEPSSPSGKYRAAQSSEGGPGGDLDSKKSPSSSLSSLPLKKRKLLLAEGAANSSSSTGTTGSGGATGSSGAGDGGGSSGNNRIARLIAGSDRPRKSPREHASTLAILSLLSQQQHRKRAAAIKILTSPKKATTTTAQSLLANQERHQQDTDSNSGHGDEQQRPSSVTDRSGVSGAGGTSIKFERPLFPDSSYINSRNLCMELDTFFTEELEQVYGVSSSSSVVKPALDEKQEERPAEGMREEESTATRQRLEMNSDEPSLQLPLSPSVLREGVAIERQQLPVSKRDLLDVLQTVRREPPLSLKLVQRCETVVKKIVQFDRKPRSMLASNGGYGGAVIGLQLFDGTSSSALGCSGSGLVGGVGHGVSGCAGGSVLKKRINRTGWPTNKRKIGTRTRQQSRFLRPMMLSASSAASRQQPSEDVGEESVPMIKKEKDDEEEEEDEDEEEEEDHSGVRSDEVVPRHEVDERDHDDNREEEDDEEEDSGPEEDEEENEEDEEEDDGETVIEMAQRRRGRPAKVSSKKAQGQSSITASGNRGKSNEKSERKSHHQTNNSPERATEVAMETVEHRQEQFQSRRSRKSSGCANVTTVVAVGSSDSIAVQRKADSAPQQASPAQDVTEQRKPPTSSSFFDTMPTLRAALMRDNSQQIQRQLSRSLATTHSSPSNALSSVPASSSPLSLTLPPPSPSPKISPTVGQQTLINPPPKPTDPSSMQQLLSPGSRVSTSSSGVVGTACSKYVTKTTTTMTRVDYTGGPVGGCASNSESGGTPNRATTNSSKPKRKSRDILRTTEEATAASQRLTADGDGGSTMVRMNRYPTQRCSTTNNTVDDDDKECDSISSRSIFVSDDCDTTSSSTMVNAPPEDAPHPGVDRHSVTTGSNTNAIRANDTHAVGSWKDRDESVTAEDEEYENEKEQQSRSVIATAATTALQRSPRTPSERIRNKLVAKNRRMSALFKRRLSTTATSSPARVVKLTPAKLNVLSNNTQLTVPVPKRRGTTKPIEPVSLLPPPSMMPLSPPLTTSTSSSSSSSCADDKPMSPAVAIAAVPVGSNTPASTADSGLFTSSQPSKVKTRSATKGRPPVRRTYSGVKGRGRGKTKNASMLMMDHLNTTTIRLPYVSLVKTTFTGIDKEPSVIANYTATTTTSTTSTTTTTTDSATTTIEKPSPKRKGAKGAKATKQGRRAKLAKRGTTSSSRGKSRSPRKQQRNDPPSSATERLFTDTDAVEDEHEEDEEDEEDATPIVKVRRRKQIIAKREDDERLEVFNHDNEDDRDEHAIGQEHKPTKRKQQLKLKVFNHGNHHYTYDSTFAVTPATTISNGILEHSKEERPHVQQRNIGDVGNANAAGVKCHDSNVMSSETDEPAQPDADDVHQLVEEHLIEVENEDEEHLLDSEDSEDDDTGERNKGSTKIEMLELMEVVENNDQEDEEAHHHQHEGDEDYNHRQQQQQQQDMLNQHDGDDDEDTFLTGDDVEVEEQEDLAAELERSATRIMNNDHPYANSSEDLTHRHHQRYSNHRQHHHHDHDHHGVTTDEEETEYVEVHELEAEVDEEEEEEEEGEEEEELDAMDEEATSSHVGGEEDHLHQLGEDEDEEEEESNGEEITQRTLHDSLSSNSHIVTAASSLNSSPAKTSTATGTATATATATTSPNKYSPRKLRKPRGRWYRER